MTFIILGLTESYMSSSVYSQDTDAYSQSTDVYSQNTDVYPPPRLIFWETTAGCNLACIHCRRITVADELLPQDLTTEESLDLVDQIAEDACTDPV